MSTQLPLIFSKTGRLRRSLKVRLKRSAKTAPKDVILEKSSIFSVFEKF